MAKVWIVYRDDDAPFNVEVYKDTTVFKQYFPDEEWYDLPESLGHAMVSEPSGLIAEWREVHG